MKDWDTACPDWQERIVEGRGLIPFKPLFPQEAAAAGDVFRQLQIVDAPGSPMIGDACRPWVFDFCDAVFGAYDAESGRRLIREFFLLVSKKNSKSTIAAAIMLTALLRNWRISGEFIILAPTIEIADNSFKPASDMIRANEELSQLLHVQSHIRTITHKTTGATLKSVAADNETVGGKKAIGVLVDELWLFGKRPNAENMLREACGGLASRPEGFVIYLSTQSDDPPAGIFRQKLNYFRGVRDGRIKDKKSLGVLYEFPDAMLQAKAERLPQNFHITNPNIGASVDEEFLESEYLKAEQGGEESLRGFLAKHLNVEIGLALRSDRWTGADLWEAAGDRALTLESLIERSEVVTAGIDGGGLDDLLGLAFIGRDAETQKWLHWSHAWAHKMVLKRRQSEAPLLRDLERNGELTIVDELPDDVTELVEFVQQVEESGKLSGVGLDPMGVGAIVDALEAIGINGERVVGIPQGWQMMGAIKTTERKLSDRTFIHGLQQLMSWAVSNARVEPRGNAITITKQAAGTGKIDPLMATFDAVALMSRNPEARNGRSVYEEIAASNAAAREQAPAAAVPVRRRGGWEDEDL